VRVGPCTARRQDPHPQRGRRSSGGRAVGVGPGHSRSPTTRFAITLKADPGSSRSACSNCRSSIPTHSSSLVQFLDTGRHAYQSIAPQASAKLCTAHVRQQITPAALRRGPDRPPARERPTGPATRLGSAPRRSAAPGCWPGPAAMRTAPSGCPSRVAPSLLLSRHLQRPLAQRRQVARVGVQRLMNPCPPQVILTDQLRSWPSGSRACGPCRCSVIQVLNVRPRVADDDPHRPPGTGPRRRATGGPQPALALGVMALGPRGLSLRQSRRRCRIWLASPITARSGVTATCVAHVNPAAPPLPICPTLSSSASSCV